MGSYTLVAGCSPFNPEVVTLLELLVGGHHGPTNVRST